MQTNILQHTINYNFFEEDNLKLDDSNEEHIAYMITQGYAEGELNQGDDEVRGWWSINR